MKRVLIIEDDEVVAGIYRNKLTEEGHQVEVATDGETGLRRILESRPDTVLLDLILPKLTGVELIRKVRQEHGLVRMPILVFSNSHMTSMLQEAWKAGATKCLSKASTSPQQVLDTIRELLDSTSIPFLATRAAARQTAAAASMPGAPSALGEVRAQFLNDLPLTLSNLRTLHRGLSKAENESTRFRTLQDLFERVHSLATAASVAELPSLTRVAEGFAALLLEFEKPENLNTSTLRTIANTIDFLGFVVENGLVLLDEDLSDATILVVDDEPISRRAVRLALEKGKLRSICVADPKSALQIAEENHFDLIVLDVSMPGMSGFDLCTAIRALPNGQGSPTVIFVTGLNDLESRVKSTVSGGVDFIGKPFLYPELALKVLCYVLRGRFTQAREKKRRLNSTIAPRRTVEA